MNKTTNSNWPKALPKTLIKPAILAVGLACSGISQAQTMERYSIRSNQPSNLPTMSVNGFSQQSISNRQQAVSRSIQAIEADLSNYGIQLNGRLSTLAPVAFAQMTSQQAERLRQMGYEVHRSTQMYLVEDEYSQTVEQQADSMPWGINKIGSEQTWGTTTGSNVKVCVVDGGMDIDHYDLASNYQNGKSLDRQNDTVDDDENSHGTHVAGTIAALKNDTGVVGVAPNAQLYIADVFDKNGSAYTDDILQGVDWCVSQGAQVINMSYGGSSSDSNQESTYQAAYDAGVVMVAASGNGGSNNLPIYPARYSTTIAVNGTDSNDNIYNNGQQGPQIDVSAPGVNINSTTRNGGTGQKTGTSMAAPHVTGAVALILDAKPSLSIEEVRSVLRDTAVDLGAPGHDNAFGAGLINVKAAVDKVSDGDMSTPTEAEFSYRISDVYNVSFSDESQAGSDKDGNKLTIESWSWSFGDRNSSSEQNPTHTYAEEGNYNVELTVTDSSGESYTSTQIVKISDIVTPPDEIELVPGKTYNLSGNAGEWSYYYFNNTDAANKVISALTSGGNGDIDLYIRYQEKPTLDIFDCRSYSPNNNESCTISNLQQGVYKVGVYYYSSSQNATLTFNVSKDSNGNCDGIDVWSGSTSYLPGDLVSVNGVEYKALWWNYNKNPEQNHGNWFSPWEKIGSCNR
ncbi:S8 family serine peptidase [Aliikangiella sp. IMCC44359]|uniref:S8 family serine peptidase n=1 Tax=Aliikangiella sp. IMCC44359 TaxID=3459125 RepID=UPI00403A9E14